VEFLNGCVVGSVRKFLNGRRDG